MRYLMLLTAVVFIAGCRYQGQLDEVYSLEEEKILLESNFNGPLTPNEQTSVKRYFSTIKELGYRLKTDKRFFNYFHRKYFGYYQSGTCADLILPKDAYEKLMGRCEVSGFFICSEDARNYIEMLRSIEDDLTRLEREALGQEAGCGERLRELGVFDEAF